MDGVSAPEPRPVGILPAIGWGLLTSLLTGPFAMLAMSVAVAVKDPTELTDGPLLTNLGELLGFILYGSLFAIPFAVIIAWLPITVLGLIVSRFTYRIGVAADRAVHAATGALFGPLVLLALSWPEADLWYLGFGAACGVFAALTFRWWSRLHLRRVERAVS